MALTLTCDQCSRYFEYGGIGQPSKRCGAECDAASNRDRQRRFLARARQNRATIEALERIFGADTIAALIESANT